MNWHPVKIVLLVLLIFANLFLLGTAAGGKIEEDRQYEESAATLSTLLATHGIDIDEAFLTVKDAPGGYHTFAAPIGDLMTSAATRLFGSPPTAVFLLPRGLCAEIDDGRSLTLSYDGQITFSATDGASLPASFSPVDEDDAVKADLALLSEKIALGMTELVPVGVCETDSETYYDCRQTLDDLPVFGSACVFGLADGELTAAAGSLFLPGGVHTFTAAPCLDRMNIMLSELRRGARGRVESLSLCYAVYENGERTKLFAYPAYEIVYATGDGTQTVCVCALDGTRYSR
ncbi:MAG: hypothetical protein IJS44_05855 [Clostridia bacterium]|nr:hypothetical protein [Clostridia bacterium]